MKEFTGFKRGVNLGGWLSQCDNRDYSREHFAAFITGADFDKIAAWGLDHVRLPFDYNVIMTDSGEFIEEGFERIDFAVGQCEKYGLNIVLDLHKTVGFVFDDESYCSFFEDERLQDMFVELWREMSRRYGGNKRVVFELLNEVTDIKFAQKWNEIAARTIAEIRKLAPDTRIMYGGIRNNSIYGLTLLDKPADDNVVFDFHCYSPLVFTHQKAYWVPELPKNFTLTYPQTEQAMLEHTRRFFGSKFDDEFTLNNPTMMDSGYFERLFEQAKRVSEKFDVPLYCGEYGVIDQADPESAVRWFADINAALEKMNISRAAWTYKKKDFGLTDGHYSGVLDKIVKLL